MKETIKCYKCGCVIGTFEGWDDLSKYHSQNNGVGGKSEYECECCKKQRERAYDDYVDPLGVYH